MKNQEAGWTVLVGASTGIGLATVKALLGQGHKVIATGRKASDLQHLNSLGAQAIKLDLTSAVGISGAITSILQISGRRIDNLILNAGVGQPGAIEDVPVDAFRSTFETNLFGPLQIMQGLMGALRNSNRGRIVWVSSVLGFFPTAYRGAYSSTKFAMECIADTLRIELHNSQIKTVLIEPGPIATNFRKTSRVRFEVVDRITSSHAKNYSLLIRRLESPDTVSGSTLAPEAVAKCISEVLRSKSPKARYRVCNSTKLAWIIRHFLPTALVDWLAIRSFRLEMRSQSSSSYGMGGPQDGAA